MAFKKLTGYAAGYQHDSHHCFQYVPEYGHRTGERTEIGIRNVCRVTSTDGGKTEVQFEITTHKPDTRGHDRQTHIGFTVPAEMIEEIVKAITVEFKKP